MDTILDPAALDALRPQFAGELLGPDDEGYEAGRRIWNGMIDNIRVLLFTPILFLVMGWALGPPCEVHAQELATIEVDAQLSNMPARAIATARDHHFVVDSPPPLGGSNEEINPIEVLLSALASCGVLVSEKVAQEQDIPLSAATAAAEGDLDPRGVRGEPVNPRIQAFRVRLALSGPSEEQAESLVEAVRTRCPIYTTLERSAPIEMELELLSE